MEDLNNQQKQNEVDKTVIFNSGESTNKVKKDDQTKIEFSKDKESVKLINNSEKPDITNPLDEDNVGKTPNTDDLKKNLKKDKKSVPPEVVAAAAAAGAGLGLGVGTVYSEEIKNVFTTNTSDTPENQEEEIQEVTGIESDSIPNIENELNYQFVDQNGIYEVNMVDLNSDGHADTLSMHAVLVDGSSISYTATGDTLNTLFSSNQTTFAEPIDYVTYLCNNDLPDFDPSVLGAQSYHIQQGDTLTEIAEANNTSIESILALNPQITDENMIYTGDNILIPTGDTDDLYLCWTPNDIESVSSLTGLNTETSSIVQANFNEMDWQSFEDQPIDEYSVSLNETDFASMETPESYLDYSNDIDSLDFI
jgi:LysM repeat protein